ncbi:MAG: DUF3501 family protein [Candidatus Thermoplasmatota archaeon]|nr:DUF3501 family protein [Candidatus Thermoplasmatota archaeon]
MGKQITAADVLSPEKYGKIREAENHRLAEFERHRRLVTKTFSFLFEHREIVLNQINEMVFLEKIHDEDEINQLIRVYSDQLPGKGFLSLTMFIELEDEHTMVQAMTKLSGVEKHVFLVFGGNEMPAEYEEGRSTDTLESTVQYLKFRFSSDKLRDFVASDAAYIEVRHPGFEETARIPKELLAVLKAELSG